MELITLKCNCCGGSVSQKNTLLRCDYCGTNFMAAPEKLNPNPSRGLTNRPPMVYGAPAALQIAMIGSAMGATAGIFGMALRKR